MLQILYRLYLLVCGPFLFIICGIIVFMQIILHPITWALTGKQLEEIPSLGLLILKKLCKPIYNVLINLTRKDQTFIMTVAICVSVLASIVGHFTIDNSLGDLQMRIAGLLGSSAMYFVYLFTR